MKLFVVVSLLLLTGYSEQGSYGVGGLGKYSLVSGNFNLGGRQFWPQVNSQAKCQQLCQQQIKCVGYWVKYGKGCTTYTNYIIRKMPGLSTRFYVRNPIPSDIYTLMHNQKTYQEHIPFGKRFIIIQGNYGASLYENPTHLNINNCANRCYKKMQCIGFRHRSNQCFLYSSFVPVTTYSPLTIYIKIQQNIPDTTYATGFEHKPGMYKGNVILHNELPRRGLCAKQCYLTNNCAGFEFRNNRCYLFSTIKTGQAIKYIDYWSKNHLNNNGFQILEGRYMLNGGKQIQTAGGIPACASFCQKLPNCKAYTYNKGICKIYTQYVTQPQGPIVTFYGKPGPIISQTPVIPSLTTFPLLKDFIWAPGHYKVNTMEKDRNIRNLNGCAKICYSNRVCQGFKYDNQICTLYRSYDNDKTAILTNLWKRKFEQGFPDVTTTIIKQSFSSITGRYILMRLQPPVTTFGSNVECARVCYLNAACVAYQFESSVCSMYSSYSKGGLGIPMVRVYIRMGTHPTPQVPTFPQIPIMQSVPTMPVFPSLSTSPFRNEFSYTPGKYKVTVIETEQNIGNLNGCERICHMNNLCKAFRYEKLICTLYGSYYNDNSAVPINLWKKNYLPVGMPDVTTTIIRQSFESIVGHYVLTKLQSPVTMFGSSDECARVCYVTAVCVAYQFESSLCSMYSSYSKGGFGTPVVRVFVKMGTHPIPLSPMVRQIPIVPLVQQTPLIPVVPEMQTVPVVSRLPPLNDFIFTPGKYKVDEIDREENVINLKNCAKICYSNKLCQGFNYDHRVCSIYRSCDNDDTGIMIRLWKRRFPLGTEIHNGIRKLSNAIIRKRFTAMIGHYVLINLQPPTTTFGSNGACASACYPNAACVAYRFHNSVCFLYSSYRKGGFDTPMVAVNVRTVTHSVSPVMEGSILGMPQFGDRFGSQYGPYEATVIGRPRIDILNPQTCADKCYSLGKCTAFRYRNHKCYLYSSYHRGGPRTPSMQFYVKRGGLVLEEFKDAESYFPRFAPQSGNYKLVPIGNPITNMMSVSMCAKKCYLMPRCQAFRFLHKICYAFSSWREIDPEMPFATIYVKKAYQMPVPKPIHSMLYAEPNSFTRHFHIITGHYNLAPIGGPRVGIQNLDGCANSCYSMESCSAFQFNVPTCWLYSSYSQGGSQLPAVTIYTKINSQRTRETSQFMRHFNYAPGNYEVRILRITPSITSIQVCAKTCHFTPSCHGFRYFSNVCVIYAACKRDFSGKYIPMWLKKVNIAAHSFYKFGMPLQHFTQITGHFHVSLIESPRYDINTLDSCADICNSMTVCSAFQYNSQTCSLYSSCLQGGPELGTITVYTKNNFQPPASASIHYMNGFKYIMGNYKAHILQIVRGISSDEMCAKACYYNAACRGFKELRNACIFFDYCIPSASSQYIGIWLRNPPHKNEYPITNSETIQNSFTTVTGCYTLTPIQRAPTPMYDITTCEKACYFTPTCTAFRFSTSICYMYSRYVRGEPPLPTVTFHIRITSQTSVPLPSPLRSLKHFDHIPGRYSVKVLQTIQAIHVLENCAELCQTASACHGFDFNQGVCVLYRSFFDDPTGDFIEMWKRQRPKKLHVRHEAVDHTIEQHFSVLTGHYLVNKIKETGGIITTLPLCAQTCETMVECLAFKYQGTKCYLYSSYAEAGFEVPEVTIYAKNEQVPAASTSPVHKFLKFFARKPGTYNVQVIRIINGITTSDVCAKLCYLNPLCSGFVLSTKVCSIYRSCTFDTGFPYIQLWKRITYKEPSTVALEQSVRTLPVQVQITDTNVPVVSSSFTTTTGHYRVVPLDGYKITFTTLKICKHLCYKNQLCVAFQFRQSRCFLFRSYTREKSYFPLLTLFVKRNNLASGSSVFTIVTGRYKLDGPQRPYQVENRGLCEKYCVEMNELCIGYQFERHVGCLLYHSYSYGTLEHPVIKFYLKLDARPKRNYDFNEVNGRYILEGAHHIQSVSNRRECERACFKAGSDCVVYKFSIDFGCNLYSYYKRGHSADNIISFHRRPFVPPKGRVPFDFVRGRYVLQGETKLHGVLSKSDCEAQCYVYEDNCVAYQYLSRVSCVLYREFVVGTPMQPVIRFYRKPNSRPANFAGFTLYKGFFDLVGHLKLPHIYEQQGCENRCLDSGKKCAGYRFLAEKGCIIYSKIKVSEGRDQKTLTEVYIKPMEYVFESKRDVAFSLVRGGYNLYGPQEFEGISKQEACEKLCYHRGGLCVGYVYRTKHCINFRAFSRNANSKIVFHLRPDAEEYPAGKATSLYFQYSGIEKSYLLFKPVFGSFKLYGARLVKKCAFQQSCEHVCREAGDYCVGYKFLNGQCTIFQAYAKSDSYVREIIFIKPHAEPDDQIVADSVFRKPGEYSCPPGEFYSSRTKACRVALTWVTKFDVNLYRQCEPGWSQFGKKCYKVERCDNCRWSDPSSCRMASIHSQQQNKFIFELVKKQHVKAWIGDIRPNFAYDNETLPNYFNWDNNEPGSTEHKAEYCTAVKGNGKWASFPCSSTLGAICKYRVNIGESCDGFLASATSSSAYCYKKVLELMTWEQASNFCFHKFGGTLASITTQEISDGLAAKFNAKAAYWIGLNRRAVTWADGTIMNYNAFKDDTDLRGDYVYCGYIDAQMSEFSMQTWLQKPCTETVEARVCERDIM